MLERVLYEVVVVVNNEERVKERGSAESEPRAEPSSSDPGSTCLERPRPPSWLQNAFASEYVGLPSRISTKFRNIN